MHRTTTRAVSLPVKLSANGVVTTATMQGTIAYSAAVCGSGNVTCPFYIEELGLHTNQAVSGTWKSTPKAAPKPFTLDALELKLLQPTLGGWRPASNNVQLEARTGSFGVRFSISAAGVPPGMHRFNATNQTFIAGKIGSNGTVSLTGSITLAPGVVLSFGTP